MSIEPVFILRLDMTTAIYYYVCQQACEKYKLFQES